ncbi:winged helix-turn-helix domain-containing protein [Actinomadura barringtoniae]|uniref:Winged helix-turn-helix domain-containing protein n=1 Tax=Actinomadura barringtoniae TaxID=1427535 RepID=A0A939P603_9ACTN|nr:AfsR/SARP family transcriptional regulator [Actinomadura barringtoniae]MBO2445895.1 winged helix-turn-helix domain-containing protein [Actinomadura barringtoniae]
MAYGDGDSRSFGLLGALEIRLDGRPVTIAAGKARAVVAALLLHANQPVSLETLVDCIWEEPPRSARTVLHSLVLRLRRAFGEHDVIRTQESGYVIQVEPGELDLDRFQALLADAEQARKDEQPAAEHTHLSAALGLWRGPALADIPSESLRIGEAERLQELKFAALSRRIDLDLMLGRYSEIVGELRRLTRAHPLREGLWAQLMRALYGSGRQADALAVYQDVRQELTTELGIEPGSELQELHQAILAGTPDLTSPASEPSIPQLGSWHGLCQLPQVPGDFTGRAHDHDRLVERLSTHQDGGPVVIWGPPGIGKTALAGRVAHSLRPLYPDGQWYIELQASSPTGAVDPAGLLGDLLMASGVPTGAMPGNLQTRASAWRARLADKRVLLVLDDASGIEQITPFLPGTESCAVLITSRSALSALPGSHHHRLEQLDAAESVDMLRLIIGDHRVSAEPQAAQRIAELCAGLPMAVRILGARLTTQPALGLAVLADRLDDERHRLDELSSADLTVRTGLELSYENLDEETRRAFLHMGMLPAGDFTSWTLAALVDRADCQVLIERLTAAGLIDPATTGATGEPRYRPHDLIALYARELAEVADPRLHREALGRLLETLIAIARPMDLEAAQFLEIPPVEESLGTLTLASNAPAAPAMADLGTWVHTERRLLLATIDQACRLGDHRAAALLASLTFPALAAVGGFTHLRHALTTIHDAALKEGDEPVAWRVEYGRAVLALTNDLNEATAAFARCTGAFEQLNQPVELAYSLASLAFARSLQGVFDEESAERAVRIAQTTDRPALMALASRSHADALSAGGQPERARLCYEDALRHASELNAPEVENDILMRYGRCLLAIGDLEGATKACDKATTLIGRQRNDNNFAWCLSLRSQIHLCSGVYQEAARTAEAACTLMDLTGDIRGRATVSLDLGAAQIAAGRSAEAAKVLEMAVPILGNVGAYHAVARAERLLEDAGRQCTPRCA